MRVDIETVWDGFQLVDPPIIAQDELDVRCEATLLTSDESEP